MQAIRSQAKTNGVDIGEEQHCNKNRGKNRNT